MFLPGTPYAGRHRPTPEPRRRALPRVVLTLTVALAAAASFVAVGTGAASAATRVPTGHLDAVTALSGNRLMVRGWALDPAQSSRTIWADVYVNGRKIASVRANRPRPDVNRALHVRGRHGFAIAIGRPRSANEVKVYAVNPTRRAAGLVAGTRYLIRRPVSSISTRIVTEARRYLGAPYAYGGASPAGFDCSGYTSWVYARARVAALAHNSETQRHQVRLISRAAARPGDLIFYLSGGRAYHVAIYAGGGKQYAAPAPGQRVKIEYIWSSAVQFGTRR